MIDMDKELLLSNPRGFCTEKYIKLHYGEHYLDIMAHPGEKFSEKLYNYLYNDPLHVCPICGKPTKYKSITTGYSKFCSDYCATQSSSRNERIKQTCLNKYGVENISQSEDIKEKKLRTCMDHFGVKCGVLTEQAKQSIKDKYGVENVSQSKDIKEKKLRTCMDHFGVKCGVLTEQAKQSIKDKYGVENVSQSKDIKEKIIKTWKEHFLHKHDIHIGFDNDGKWICKCYKFSCNKCDEKQFIISQQMFNDRKRNGSELCTKLLPPGQIHKSSIELFIRDILDEYKIDYQINVRNIISPKELDIYIPSKKIAIECNGIYWHSVYNKEPKYHLNKYLACLEKGIQLIMIWEDWYRRSPDIVKSILLSKLGLISNKLYARKCLISEINTNIYKQFLKDNHIQGYSPASIKIGLFYNDKLVSVMGFGKYKSKSNNMKYELVRFCNLKNYTIIGSASKLFKYFINIYNPDKVVSYSSNDISVGKIYNLLNFKKTNLSNAYWYIHQITFDRSHRLCFNKAKLKRLGFDVENCTEYQIMRNLPYFQVYDSGTTTWEWEKKRDL